MRGTDFGAIASVGWSWVAGIQNGHNSVWGHRHRPKPGSSDARLQALRNSKSSHIPMKHNLLHFWPPWPEIFLQHILQCSLDICRQRFVPLVLVLWIPCEFPQRRCPPPPRFPTVVSPLAAIGRRVEDPLTLPACIPQHGPRPGMGSPVPMAGEGRRKVHILHQGGIDGSNLPGILPLMGSGGIWWGQAAHGWAHVQRHMACRARAHTHTHTHTHRKERGGGGADRATNQG